MVGAASVWLLSVTLAIVLGLLSLGLSRSEWRSAGHAAGVAARFSVSAGGGAVGALSRGAGGVTGASGWLVNLVNRGPGLAPDEPVAPPAAPSVRTPVVREGAKRGEAPLPDPVPAIPARGDGRAGGGRSGADAQAGAAEPAAGGRRLDVPVAVTAEGPAAARVDRPERGVAAGECAAAGDGAVGLRRAGGDRRNPAGPGGDAV